MASSDVVTVKVVSKGTVDIKAEIGMTAEQLRKALVASDAVSDEVVLVLAKAAMVNGKEVIKGLEPSTQIKPGDDIRATAHHTNG